MPCEGFHWPCAVADEPNVVPMMSRGLPPSEARALLLEGFVMGLWDDAPDPAIGDAARAALRAIA